MRVHPKRVCRLLCAAWLCWLSLARAQDGSAPHAPAPEYSAVATASRLARPLRLVPATVVVLPREELDQHPALTTDSVLRSVPSAATFRRSTSLNADPSAQGVNLRGVGPSGVSRTLVLLDGVPVNDPFGGSVYFRALPRLGIERIEIVPGGGSALYGSSALSGVVQLFSRASLPRRLEGDVSYGLANTLLLAARGAGGTELASASLEGEWLSSDGFHVVSAQDRGAIDHPAGSAHGTLNARGSLTLNPRFRLFAGVNLFREELHGGTRFTNAAAQLATLSAGSDYAAARGNLKFLLFARLALFEQERARVAAERASEQRSVRQRVPAADQGVSVVWSSAQNPAGSEHAWALGIDTRHVDGSSNERLFPATMDADALISRQVGGQQLLFGSFAEDVWQVTRWLQLNAALRFDVVRNYGGTSEIERSMAPVALTSFAAHNAYAGSPRLGVLLEPWSFLRVRASAYRSFRAPTLNELYRPFQVGTVLTAANDELRPEHLTGGELGVESVSWDVLTLRATAFWNALEDPITNATLPAPAPDGATRQRRNLGRARVRGAELGSELRLASRWSILLAYTFVDARVTGAGGNPEVLGKRLAQDPVHRASGLVLFDEPRWLTASLQLRVVGSQFEDDLNTLPMKGYALVDVFLARRLFWQLELFGAIENLFNQSYLVGRAGVDTIGQPLLARVGLRVRMRD